MYTEKQYTEAKTEAQNKLTAYVEKVNANKPAANEIAGAKEALDNAIAKYNELVVSDAYERLFLRKGATEVGEITDAAEYLSQVDPLQNAIEAYRFAGIMKATFKRDKDTGRITTAGLTCVADDDDAAKKQVYKLRDIESKWAELTDKCEKKARLMHSDEWSTLVYRMQRLFTARSLSRGGYIIPSGLTADYIVYVGTTPVAISELTAEQKKKLDTSVSIGALKEELQALVDAIYFDSTGRENGSNKFRVKEKDVHWVEDNAHKFDTRTHKTVMMTGDVAFELAFCLTAHVVTGKDYDAIIGE